MGSDPKNKKYLFDLNNFDEDAEELKRKKEPPVPTFSLEDMESARRQSFDKGKEEGARIAKESIEQRTEILVQSIAQNLTALDAQEEKRNTRFVDDSVLMVYKALQASLPALMHEAAENEIKQALATFFAASNRAAQYKLFIHPDMKDAIGKYVSMLHSNLTLETDASLPATGARVEWAAGGADWAPEKAGQAVLDIIRPFIKDKSELLDDSAKKTHNKDETPDDQAQAAPSSDQDGDL